MSHKIRYRLLLLNARLLRNMIAVIGLAGFLAACSGGDKKENQVNQDSLNKVKEQQRLDSIAKVKDDSIAQVRADSISKAREDSINKAKGQNSSSTVTGVPVLNGNKPITKYGVPIDYNEITPTKYGSPSVN
ncbi:hypothetical protein SDC9_73276 [bioreactor metagenome]|uniref:Lipoprotein n=1 Tax=bioreactor metagenome TaxID=1076179 RepID=A0A644YFV0_9ZZZZ